MLKIASCSSLRKRAKSLGTLETSDFRGFLSNTGLTFESFRPSQNTPVKSLRKLLRPFNAFFNTNSSVGKTGVSQRHGIYQRETPS